MSGHLIIPIVQTPTRHHLAIENEDGGIASVEILITTHALSGHEHVGVVVTLDDPGSGTVVDMTVNVA